MKSTSYANLAVVLSATISFQQNIPYVLPFVFDHTVRRYRFAGSLDEEGQQTVSGQPLTVTLAPNPGELHDTMPLTFDLLDFWY